MLFRVVVLVTIVLFSFILGFNNYNDFTGLLPIFLYPITSLILGLIIIWVEINAHKANGRVLLFSFVGMICGFVLGWFFGEVFINLFPYFSDSFKIIFMLMFSYMGFTLAWLKSDEIKVNYIDKYSSLASPTNHRMAKPKLLDTSVIIDGRIADISETGFLEGDLIIPRFVLNELQQVADSSDSLKRSRGRRGLDILNSMKSSKKTTIKIVDDDFKDVPDVDSKLLKLARSYGDAVVITNDFNLNKVAEFQGVNIFNINELANAIKPILLPNEEIRITVVKEGKDQNQGIAYLDDGTMIVVDNGKNYIGKNVIVSVTSILQTPAGRMIFTQITNVSS